MTECPYCDKEFELKKAAMKPADEPGEELRRCPHCDKWSWDGPGHEMIAIASETEEAF